MLSKLIWFDLPPVKSSNSLCLWLQCDSLRRKLGKSLIPLSVVGRRKKSHQLGICHIRSPGRRNEGRISAAPLSGNRALLPALILSCKCYFLLPPPKCHSSFSLCSIVFCSFHVHSTCKSGDQGARLRVLESCGGGAPHNGITRSALWGLLLTII